MNRSLDGVLDELNTKNMTDAGPLDLITDAASDDELGDAGLKGKQCMFADNIRVSMLIKSLALQCVDPACELLHQVSSQLFLTCRGQVLEHDLQLTASRWHCRRLAEHGQPQPQARWQQRLLKQSCSTGASLPLWCP